MFKRNFFLCALFILSLLSPSLQAWEAFVFADANYGAVRGFAQIPRGGVVGTSSVERPSLKELGIHQTWFYEVGVGLKREDYSIWLDYHYINLKNHTLLKHPLITHNQFIADTSPFHVKLNYDWYALGLQKDWPAEKSILSFLLLANFFDYNYQYAYPTISSNRTFIHFAANVGFQIERYFNPAFSARFEVDTSLPFFNLNITNINTSFYYHKKYKSCVLHPFLAINFLRVKLKDDQELPNYIYFTSTPYGSVGLKVSFPGL